MWGNSIFSVGPKFQSGPPAMRAGPIRCRCEWIFYAIFVFVFVSICICVLLMVRYSEHILMSQGTFTTILLCQLHASTMHTKVSQRCTDVVIWSYTTVTEAFRLPFLCIFTNMEVHERYLPIIRVQKRRSLASQGTLTTWNADILLKKPADTIYCKFYIFKCFRNSIEKIDFSSFLFCNILLVW